MDAQLVLFHHARAEQDSDRQRPATSNFFSQSKLKYFSAEQRGSDAEAGATEAGSAVDRNITKCRTSLVRHLVPVHANYRVQLLLHPALSAKDHIAEQPAVLNHHNKRK